MNKLEQAVEQYEGISEQFNKFISVAEAELVDMKGVSLISDEQGYKLSALGKTIRLRFKMVNTISNNSLGELTAYFVRGNLTGRNRDNDVTILHNLWFDKLGNVYATSYNDHSSYNINLDSNVFLRFVQKSFEVLLESSEFMPESDSL